MIGRSFAAQLSHQRGASIPVAAAADAPAIVASAVAIVASAVEIVEPKRVFPVVGEGFVVSMVVEYREFAG